MTIDSAPPDPSLEVSPTALATPSPTPRARLVAAALAEQAGCALAAGTLMSATR
jgi:hypothetical protein